MGEVAGEVKDEELVIHREADREEEGEVGGEEGRRRGREPEKSGVRRNSLLTQNV